MTPGILCTPGGVLSLMPYDANTPRNSPQLAEERTAMREGHFYKPDETGRRDEEWCFAPVTFDHERLDGAESVSCNVAKLVEILRRDH